MLLLAVSGLLIIADCLSSLFKLINAFLASILFDCNTCCVSSMCLVIKFVTLVKSNTGLIVSAAVLSFLFPNVSDNALVAIRSFIPPNGDATIAVTLSSGWKFATTPSLILSTASLLTAPCGAATFLSVIPGIDLPVVHSVSSSLTFLIKFVTVDPILGNPNCNPSIKLVKLVLKSASICFLPNNSSNGPLALLISISLYVLSSSAVSVYVFAVLRPFSTAPSIILTFNP